MICSAQSLVPAGGSGGADVAEQIDEALAQAKAYTDQSLTITEF